MACCCGDNIEALKKKLEEKLKEARELKESYQNLLVENLQKDLIIKKLKEKIQSKKYSNFEGIFTVECIEHLNLLDNSQPNDSTFIHVALLNLYRNDPNILKQKTISGRGDKAAITPKKIEILERLFSERLSHVSEPTETRKYNINKLIRNAISTEIRKK